MVIEGNSSCNTGMFLFIYGVKTSEVERHFPLYAGFLHSMEFDFNMFSCLDKRKESIENICVSRLLPIF